MTQGGESGTVDPVTDGAESRIALSVRTARSRLGWSRETLAHRSGVSFAAITQIEAGRRKDIRLSSLAALAAALQVSTDYLVGVRPADSPRLLHHEALLYETNEALVELAIPFLLGGLEAGHGVLAVTTPDRIRSLRKVLGPDGKRVEFADSSRWYTGPADAIARYREFIDTQFALGVPWIRILGEPAWSRRSPAQQAPWTRYEAYVNVAFAASPVTIVCPYDTRSVTAAMLECAASTHPEVTGDVEHAAAAYRSAEELLLDPDL